MKMYINWAHAGKTETVDEVDSKEFPSAKAFRHEVARLVQEYQMAFRLGSVYSSARSTKDWQNR